MSPTILICEDDEPMRRLIVTILSRRGYDLRVAEHGQAGLDELVAGRPDLTILDVHMPGVGGLEILRRIRDDPALATMPVLLLSGSRDALHPGWGLRVGADDHLAKPFSIAELEARVGALLEQQ